MFVSGKNMMAPTGGEKRFSWRVLTMGPAIFNRFYSYALTFEKLNVNKRRTAVIFGTRSYLKLFLRM